MAAVLDKSGGEIEVGLLARDAVELDERRLHLRVAVDLGRVAEPAHQQVRKFTCNSDYLRRGRITAALSGHRRLEQMPRTVHFVAEVQLAPLLVPVLDLVVRVEIAVGVLRFFQQAHNIGDKSGLVARPERGFERLVHIGVREPETLELARGITGHPAQIGQVAVFVELRDAVRQGRGGVTCLPAAEQALRPQRHGVARQGPQRGDGTGGGHDWPVRSVHHGVFLNP